VILATWAMACALSGQSSAPAASPPSPIVTGEVYALVFSTGPSWDKAKPPGEQAFFADHSKNLRDLRAEGRLLLGGRFSDQGLVLVRAASLDEARALVDRDPSVQNGTFQAEVHLFRAFMPGCVGSEPQK
jgi:uncharacterized protein YciI